jgi:hypothetical protein
MMLWYSDDDVVRTSVLQTRVTATLYWENVPQDSVYITRSSLHISDKKKKWGGKETDSQHDTRISPSSAHTSQQTLHVIQQGLPFTWIFIQYFVTGED